MLFDGFPQIRIPNLVLFDTKLTWREKHLYVGLLHLAGESFDELGNPPAPFVTSNEEISQISGFGVRTVVKHMRALKNRGLVLVCHESGHKNKYILTNLASVYTEEDAEKVEARLTKAREG